MKKLILGITLISFITNSEAQTTSTSFLDQNILAVTNVSIEPVVYPEYDFNPKSFSKHENQKNSFKSLRTNSNFWYDANLWKLKKVKKHPINEFILTLKDSKLKAKLESYSTKLSLQDLNSYTIALKQEEYSNYQPLNIEYRTVNGLKVLTSLSEGVNKKGDKIASISYCFVNENGSLIYSVEGKIEEFYSTIGEVENLLNGLTEN